jgi:hypothetical protein
MKRLYRLKGNPSTIVTKEGGFHKVFSFDHQNSSWVMAKWNPDNVTPLSEREAEEIRKLGVTGVNLAWRAGYKHYAENVVHGKKAHIPYKPGTIARKVFNRGYKAAFREYHLS